MADATCMRSANAPVKRGKRLRFPNEFSTSRTSDWTAEFHFEDFRPLCVSRLESMFPK